MKKERRRNTRIAANFEVRVVAGRKVIPLKTWNLSLRGMECPSEACFKQGSACQVKFKLSPEISFSIKGKFVRVSQQDTGIFFASMDEEAFYHLKRLVQYNAANPDRIDTELAAPFHHAAK
jgi:hypothetical protein